LVEAFFALIERGDVVEAARAAGDEWTEQRLREQLAISGSTAGRVTVDGTPSSAQWASIEMRWWISDDGTCRAKVELWLVVDEERTDHSAVFIGHTSGDGFALELESLG
jgi:hypothetical protein